MHERIATSSPILGERRIGWLAHYSIGIGFSALLVSTFGLDWARSPTLYPALIVGLATFVAPLFVLQPAMGAGIASTRTATPIFNSLKSIVTHMVFGLGMYLSAYATAALVPPVG